MRKSGGDYVKTFTQRVQGLVGKGLSEQQAICMEMDAFERHLNGRISTVSAKVKRMERGQERLQRLDTAGDPE